MEAIPKRKLKWWQWGLIGFFVLVLLNAITPNRKPSAVDKKPAVPTFSDADPEFTVIGRNHYAMVFNRQADPNSLADIARQKCTKAQFCDLHGWTEAKFAAGAIPLTDRESQALVFSYSLNRTTGFEQALFDCDVWKRQPAECLAKGE